MRPSPGKKVGQAELAFTSGAGEQRFLNAVPARFYSILMPAVVGWFAGPSGDKSMADAFYLAIGTAFFLVTLMAVQILDRLQGKP
jgi:hypothetical protein